MPNTHALLSLLRRPPWRTVIPALAFLGLCAAAYGVWSPGKTIRDGRHDLGRNGIWLQHGWLGDDGWFQRYGRDVTLFRDDARVRQLATTLAAHRIRYVYPHLCPSAPDGAVPPVDRHQTERFLRHFASFRVIPWVGGVLDSDCFPDSPEWRKKFVASIRRLLTEYTFLAGVHVNIEPMPSGNPDFLLLLREIRQALPRDKILSVAAYPPPTRWHPFPEVHWDEAYYRQVAAEADQLADDVRHQHSFAEGVSEPDACMDFPGTRLECARRGAAGRSDIRGRGSGLPSSLR